MKTKLGKDDKEAKTSKELSGQVGERLFIFQELTNGPSVALQQFRME